LVLVKAGQRVFFSRNELAPARLISVQNPAANRLSISGTTASASAACFASQLLPPPISETSSLLAAEPFFFARSRGLGRRTHPKIGAEQDKGSLLQFWPGEGGDVQGATLVAAASVRCRINNRLRQHQPARW